MLAVIVVPLMKGFENGIVEQSVGDVKFAVKKRRRLVPVNFY